MALQDRTSTNGMREALDAIEADIRPLERLYDLKLRVCQLEELQQQESEIEQGKMVDHPPGVKELVSTLAIIAAIGSVICTILVFLSRCR